MSNFIATGGYSIKNVFDGDPAKNYRLILDNTSIIKDNLNQSIAPERLLISSVEISGTSDPIPFPGYFKIFIKSNAGITRQEYNQLYLNGELDPEGLYVVGEMSNLLVETYRSLQAEDSTTLELSYLPDSIAVYVYLYRDAEFQTLVDIATAPITSDGVKIRKITVEYKIDDQGLIPPTAGWAEAIPESVPGKYLWTRITTEFDDGNKSVSYSVGGQGATGKGILEAKDQYNLSTSIMEANGEWKDTMPSFISGRYIWTRMEIKWTDNSISHTDATLAHSINETNQRIADMADDNRLTPDEKVTLRRELDIIISERTQVDQQASDYSPIVSERTNFNTAYTTLYNYVNPKLANLTTTEAVNGATLRTYFTDYITKRELLRRKITAESLKEAKRDAAEKDSVIVDRVIEVESEIDADSIVSKVRASTSYVEDLSVFSTKEEAEGYAGAARDEAIAAAESDAQNKANAAYNDAAVYADGIQTTLTDRVEQAEEKITAEAITQTVTSSSTYQEQMANLEPIVHKQATSPDHILNRLWLDTASEPNVMYRSDGSEWIRTSPTSAEDLGAYKAEDAAQLKTDLTGELTTLSTTVEELGSSITSTATAIRTEVSENYTTITDFGTYQTTVATAFEETSKDFNMSFTSVNSAVEAVDGKLTETTEEIRKNIRFVDGKIVLGNTESAIMLEIANDRISFLQVGNPNPVAYISDDTLHITDGNFLSSLRMGNFAFMPNAENGNLSFTKVV